MKNKLKQHTAISVLSSPTVQYCILSFILLALLLTIFPKLDISFSSIFYVFPLDFVHKTDPIAVGIFRLVPIVTTVFGSFCFLYLLYFIYQKKSLSSPAFFLLITLVIGPGLIINYGFKEHFGRARPRHVLEFGGDKAFTPAARMSDQCKKNCSFTSGHASMGYYISSFSYIVPQPYKTIVFLLGTVLGSIIGIARVIQGGHFLSDVIYSALIVFLVNHLCFLFLQKVKLPKKKRKKR